MTIDDSHPATPDITAVRSDDPVAARLLTEYFASFAPVRTDDPETARLLDEYFAFRAAGFTTHDGGYLVSLPDPERFVPPAGVFLVVREAAAPRGPREALRNPAPADCPADAPANGPANGPAVGCGGIRHVDDIDGLTTFEVKHIWLAESARGRGWSRLLMDELERRARGFGAEQLVLDTNESLAAAQHLYRTSGYVEIPPYNTNPNATHWFAKRLGDDL